MYATAEPEYIDPSHLEGLPDGALIKRVKMGDDTALGVLLRRHRDALYRFCLHLTHNRDDAEDVCQESMARALTRVDSLQVGSAFRSWLFSIARNLSIDSHRSRSRYAPLPDEEMGPLPAPLHHESPYERVETHEEYQTVAQALSKLKKNHQTVLMLREVEGLSYAEIGARLDLSQAAVETLLFRARKRLREEYTKTGAPVPAVGILGALRGLLARLAAKVAGAPLVAKLAATVLLIGGAAVATPNLVPALHAASGGGLSGGALVGQSGTSTSSAPAVTGHVPSRPHVTGSTHHVTHHTGGAAGSTTVAHSGTGTHHQTTHTHTRFHRVPGHAPVSGAGVTGKHQTGGTASTGSTQASSSGSGTNAGTKTDPSGTKAAGNVHAPSGTSRHGGRSGVTGGVTGGAPALSVPSSGTATSAKPSAGTSSSGSTAAAGPSTSGSSTTGRTSSGTTQSSGGSSGVIATATSTASGVQQTVSSATSGVQTTVGTTVSGAQQTVSSTVSGTQQTVSGTVSGTQQTAGGAVGAVSGAAGTAAGAAAGAQQGAQKTVSGTTSAAGNTVSGATGTVTKSVGSAPSKPTTPAPGKGVPAVPTVPVPKVPKP